MATPKTKTPNIRGASAPGGSSSGGGGGAGGGGGGGAASPAGAVGGLNVAAGGAVGGVPAGMEGVEHVPSTTVKVSGKMSSMSEKMNSSCLTTVMVSGMTNSR